MLSTGIAELDERLGGLTPGRYYLLTGTPGAGKTSASLHFLAEGLRAGERCALLTQENPDDLFAQSEFLGQNVYDAVASDQLVLLQYRLDFSSNYARAANPRVVARELIEALGPTPPTRIVADSILPFVEAGGVTHGAVLALQIVLDELAGTTAYFTVPGDLGDTFYARLYDPLVSGAAGILHFEIGQDDVRQISIRKIRQPPRSTEPLRFIVRAGLGIVEVGDGRTGAPVEGSDMRVALVNSGGRLGGELFSSVSRAYQLDTFSSLPEALGQVGTGYGAVIVALDPLSAHDVMTFVRDLRRSSGVPTVLVAEGEGLRASTRTRALRAGADEFVVMDGSAQELLSRLEAARARGYRSTVERMRRERLLVQPSDAEGRPIALPESEIVRAARHHVGTAEHPFFTLARVRVDPELSKDVWALLSRGLRVRDGDLIAQGQVAGEWVLYLHDISRRHATELLDRLFSADPRLTPESTLIEHYPAEAARIESWMASFDVAEPASSP